MTPKKTGPPPKFPSGTKMMSFRAPADKKQRAEILKRIKKMMEEYR
jgi:hypothetical protein